MRVANVDSTLWPADAWGVPMITLEAQPDRIVAPVVRWGSTSRRGRAHGGCWVFYVDDHRFGPWETLAQRVAQTEPAASVEPNYTAHDWTPRAEVLWGIYRKRRIARELQELGVPVFVDVCLPREHFDLALLGVPRGWRAYATRGFETRPGEVSDEYELAREHAGREPLMLVYGGGPAVAEVCARLPGCVHVRAPRNVSEAA